MDFTTLVAGPAQAGPQSPVSKPGIGHAAGAGAAPAADAAAGDGFASMVALALDQLDGEATPVCYAPRDGAAETDAEAGEDENVSPLDAPVDAATLSLLIALTTPAAAPAVAPEPEVVGQGSADLAVVDGGDAAGTAVTPLGAAPESGATRAAAPAAGAPGAPAFEDVLATATGPDAPTTPAPAAAPDTPAVASTPAPVAPAATPETPAVPADAAAAVQAQPATAPGPAAEPGAAAAPTPAAAPPRASQRPAVHPLRQALAAMATAPAEATANPTQPEATTATPRTAPPTAPTSAPAAASPAGHEGRGPAVSRVDAAAVAPVAAFATASDTSAAGEDSSDGAREGFAAAASSTPVRGAASGLDLAAALSAAGSVSADVTTAAPPPSLGGFGAAADTMLRAIDVPAAARFEQTLSSVDPDVRNMQAMVRTVRLFTAGSGAHEARLSLEPEHLGHVALTVRVEQGSVSAHFRAETPAAQRWIETHQQELRNGLREQGLEVKEVVVTTDPDGRRERRQEAQPARAPRPRRQQGADAPRFEVLV